MAKRKPALTVDDLKIGPGTSNLNLSSLFAAGTSRDTVMQHPIMVGIEALLDNPYQPRLEVNETSLDELAEVIKQQGFQGVLVARRRHGPGDQYQLTAGHRRREAARRAGLRVLPVVVQDLTDEEMVVRAITENIQREDLSPLEEGKIYQLMQQEMSYSYRQIAREVGKKLGYVQNRIRAAEAPPDVQAMVRARPETLHAVRYLVGIESEIVRSDVIKQLLAGALTNDDLRSFVELAKLDAGLSIPLPTQASPGDQSPLPAQLGQGLQTPHVESDSPAENRPERPIAESSGRQVSAELPGISAELVGTPDTGPLLVPKADGSGGYLVVPKDHSRQVQELPSSHVAVRDGEERSSLIENGAGAPAVRDRQHSLGRTDAYGSPGFGVPRETEGLTPIRLRRSKLATAVRALRAYRGILTADEPLTKEERTYLQEIVSLASKALDAQSV